MTQTTTRRAILGGAATLPVIAFPSITGAASADPIFTAINRFKAAYAFHGQRILEADDLRSEQKGEKWESCEEAERLSAEGCEAQATAEHALVSTVPTTAAGAIIFSRGIRFRIFER